MKIAVAAENGQVSAHFGHSHQFVVADINDGKVNSTDAVANPGHTPGSLPPFVASFGATVIIAGGMGQMAIDLFKANGVDCIIGVRGSAKEALQAFADETLEGGGSTCTEKHHH